MKESLAIKNIAIWRTFFHSKFDNSFHKPLTYYCRLLEVRFAMSSPSKRLKCWKSEMIQSHPRKLGLFKLGFFEFAIPNFYHVLNRMPFWEFKIFVCISILTRTAENVGWSVYKQSKDMFLRYKISITFFNIRIICG